jgi:prevent-host-death family protein
MEATLTDLARRTEAVFRAIRAGREVTITNHGKPLARLTPIPQRTQEEHRRFVQALRGLSGLPVPPRK